MLLGWVIGSVLIGLAGLNRKGGFLKAFLLSLILSPIIGLFLTIGGARKNPIGCSHCGNKYNEVEFCGICGENAAGSAIRKVI